MKKAIILLFVVLALTGALLIVAFAHGGKTDANGGHYDRSTGEYHYHHGYSAHSHYDMDGDGDIDCPYGFDDNTKISEEETGIRTDGDVVRNMFTYIFTIKSSEILLHIGYLGVICLVSYCSSMILISFPCSIWEKLTKKKIYYDAQEKAIFVVTICLIIVLVLCFLYQKVT